MTPSPTPDSSLAQLTAAPVRLELAGRALALSPLKMRELPAFQAAIVPLLDALAGRDLSDGAVFAELPRLLLAHAGPAMAAVALMSRQEPDWVADLDPDDFLTLAARSLAVNAAFFTTRLLPTLTRELDGLFRALGGTAAAQLPTAPTGSTSPPASSAPATATAS